MPGSGIFISYRRDDSAGFAGRLYDRLAERFGTDRVFMDIDTIAPGHEFTTDIEKALSECDACVVLIGRSWLTIADVAGGRRLDDPTDFVRLEVATAIRRGIRVFPVLVDKATSPSSAALPDEIRPLAGRQAIELTNERWNYDVGRLLLSLEEAVGPKEAPRRRHDRGASSGTSRSTSKIPLIAMGVAGLLVIAGIAAWLATRSTTHTGSAPPASSASPSESVPGVGNVAPLSGTYAVTVTLDDRSGDLGNNLLWDEDDPQENEVFGPQDWVFAPPGDPLAWVIPDRPVFKGSQLADESYVSIGRAQCDSSEARVERRLELTATEPEAPPFNSFEGTLTINWACPGADPVDARLSVSGTLSG